MNANLERHRSFSQLKLAAMCGFAYQRKYHDGEVAESRSPYALLGSAFHEGVMIFEGFHHLDIWELVANSDATDVWALNAEAERDRTGMESALWNALVDYSKERLRKGIRERGLTESNLQFLGGQNLHHFYTKKIPELARNYLDIRLNDAAAGMRAADLEVGWLEVEVDIEIDGVRFVAKIDQILQDRWGHYVPRDLKTGKPSVTDPVQMEFYNWCLRHRFGIESKYGQVIYVKDKRRTYDVIRWKLDDEAIAEMLDYLMNAVRHPEALMVTGPITGHCEVCDFRSDCRFSAISGRGVA